MRRMMWLSVGAVLGVAGYRRLDRAAKSLTGQLGSGQLGRGQLGSGQLGSGEVESGPVTRQAVQESRQRSGAVAAGLRTSAGLALSLATGIVRRAGAYRARRAAAAAAGTGAGARAGLGAGEGRASIAAFLGDVRDGMDEYLDAHEHQVRAPSRREIG
jgi:hypothetical protein